MAFQGYQHKFDLFISDFLGLVTTLHNSEATESSFLKESLYMIKLLTSNSK